MIIKLFPKILVFILALTFFAGTIKAQAPLATDMICGKWMAAENNLKVEVYKENGDYKAKIIWFKTDDDSKPMDGWTDKHNPDKNLRERKILGMNVVKDLIYEAKSNSWEHGSIYDAKNGRYWDASACLTKDGTLKVTGYWHFKFIGRTMTFKKVS
ncbi:MAG: DUF2147 domain-containing protein [Bacteroidota bacterium]